MALPFLRATIVVVRGVGVDLEHLAGDPATGSPELEDAQVVGLQLSDASRHLVAVAPPLLLRPRRMARRSPAG